jgi:anti-sigma factor RsiW
MNCNEILENLSAYQDGELGPAEAAAVDAHLASCESCRRRLADYEKVWELLGDSKLLEPGPGFTEAVLDRASARGFAAVRRPAFWIPAAAAAAVLAAVGLFFLASTGGPGPAVPPAPVAPAEAPAVSDPVLAEVESAVRADPELLEILENLDALEQIELLENLPVLEHLDEIQAGPADDLAAAAEDLVLDADLPTEER